MSIDPPTSFTLSIERPQLLEGWVWCKTLTGEWAACLFTTDIDCFVFITHDGSVKISTGIAPVEIVDAVVRYWKGTAR